MEIVLKINDKNMDNEENIIEGEILETDKEEEDSSLWFMSAIKGDLDFLKNNRHFAGSKGEGNRTALMYAAESGNLACVDLLSTLPEEIGRQDDKGYTAMMYASKNGFLDCILLLIEEENNIINNDNKRAVNIALENGHFECANVLEKYEYLDEEDTTDQDDDSNDERNLIKENKKLKKQEKIIKKANKDIDKIVEIEKAID